MEVLLLNLVESWCPQSWQIGFHTDGLGGTLAASGAAPGKSVRPYADGTDRLT